MDEAPERTGEWTEPAVSDAKRDVGGHTSAIAWIGAAAAVAGFLCDWYREAWFGIDPGFAGGNFAHNFLVVFPLYALAWAFSSSGAYAIVVYVVRRVRRGTRFPRTAWGLALPVAVSATILGYFAFRIAALALGY